MRPLGVVPGDPAPDDLSGMLVAGEDVLPDALLLEAPEEPFDHPVLLRRVRGDELLRQAVGPARRPEAPTLEDEPVVAPQRRRRASGADGAEAGQAGFFEGPLRFLGAPPQGELVPHNRPIMAIHDGREMCPAIGPTRDMGHVHRPAGVRGGGHAPPALDPGAGRPDSLMDEPALVLQHPVDRLRLIRSPSRNRRSAHSRRYPNVGWAWSRAATRVTRSAFRGRRGRAGRETSRGARRAARGTWRSRQHRRCEAWGMVPLTRWTSSDRTGGPSAPP